MLADRAASFSSRTVEEFLLSFDIEVFKDSPADGVLGLPWSAFNGVFVDDLLGVLGFLPSGNSKRNER